MTTTISTLDRQHGQTQRIQFSIFSSLLEDVAFGQIHHASNIYVIIITRLEGKRRNNVESTQNLDFLTP